MKINMEEIYFNKEGREKLILGINKLNQAVSSTLGPNGKNVIIPDRSTGKYKVNKDPNILNKHKKYTGRDLSEMYFDFTNKKEY